MQRSRIYRLAWIALCTVMAPLVLVAWLIRKLTGGLWFTFVAALADCVKFVVGSVFWWSWPFQSLRFLVALPALVVLCGVGILTLIAVRPNRAWKDNYRNAALTAYTQHDYVLADLCFRRLAHLEAETHDWAFAEACTAEALGQIDRCETIMTSIAPADGEGYALAHAWLADRLLKTRSHDPATLATVEHHLRSALEQLPRSVPLHDRLGQVYLEQGKLREAADQLAHAVAKDRSRALLVAQLYANCGDSKQAGLLAIQAAEYWKEQLVEDPGNRQARFHRAGALYFSQRFSEVVECLKAAPKPDAELTHTLAEVYVAWADLTRLSHGSHERVAELLTAALATERFNLSAVDHLARWRVMAEQGAQSFDNLFRRLDLAAAPADVFTVLASVNTDQHHLLAARSYLERAHALDPQSIPAANNLAWFLAVNSPQELRRALDLIDAAVQVSDKPRAELYDTRAEILMKLGRWGEALTDLALAAQATPSDARRRARFLLGCGRFVAVVGSTPAGVPLSSSAQR